MIEIFSAEWAVDSIQTEHEQFVLLFSAKNAKIGTNKNEKKELL